MKLINVDTLDDYIGKWADDFYENPENSDADFMDGYCMTLNRIHSGAVPVVNAIPIEWLEEKLIGHPELPYAITDGISNVLDLWKAEQEKQNEDR